MNHPIGAALRVTRSRGGGRPRRLDGLTADWPNGRQSPSLLGLPRSPDYRERRLISNSKRCDVASTRLSPRNADEQGYGRSQARSSGHRRLRRGLRLALDHPPTWSWDTDSPPSESTRPAETSPRPEAGHELGLDVRAEGTPTPTPRCSRSSRDASPAFGQATSARPRSADWVGSTSSFRAKVYARAPCSRGCGWPHELAYLVLEHDSSVSCASSPTYLLSRAEGVWLTTRRNRVPRRRRRRRWLPPRSRRPELATARDRPRSLLP